MEQEEYQSEDREENHELLSSVHGLAGANANSQQLWSPTEDVHKNKPVQLSSIDSGETPGLPFLREEYW